MQQKKTMAGTNKRILQTRIGKKDKTKRVKGNTVETHYLKLGYVKLPAISNSTHFPLDMSILFQSLTTGYL